MTTYIHQIFSFLREARAELAKIVWPKRDELIGASIIVCFLAIVFAIILGFMDFGFSRLIKQLLRS